MLLRRSSTAVLRRDGGLLDALRFELRHELSSADAPKPPQVTSFQSGRPGEGKF